MHIFKKSTHFSKKLCTFFRNLRTFSKNHAYFLKNDAHFSKKWRVSPKMHLFKKGSMLFWKKIARFPDSVKVLV